MAGLLERINLLIHKACIAAQSCIGPGCLLPHLAGVTFYGSAGQGVTLYALSICCPRDAFIGGPTWAGPRLGDDVTVGGHAVITGPVVVGDHTKVGFGVKLDCDAPPHAIVISKIMLANNYPRLAGVNLPGSR